MTTVNRPIDVEITDTKPHPGRRMTEEEFVAWCDEDTKAEWVDGEVIVMAPSSDGHARLNLWVARVIAELAEQRSLGEVRGPQTQIRIGPKRQRREPDVVFVAKDRRDIIRANHIEGAPDLIIEIVSPESVTRDWRDKYQAYEAAGVREYWVIDPNAQRMDAYQLGSEGYTQIAEVDGLVRSEVLHGFFIRTSWLWQDPLPKLAEVMRELGVRI